MLKSLRRLWPSGRLSRPEAAPAQGRIGMQLPQGPAILAERWRVPDSPERRKALAVKTFDSIPEQVLLLRLRDVEREDVIRQWKSDPWLCNYFVNLWEYVHGVEESLSYPYNVTLPIADVCNARCTFCTSWLEGSKVMPVEDVPKYADVLRHARFVGLAGHGEPLAHPFCEDLFASISALLDRRCEAYLITNGVFLRKQKRALASINIMTYNISLNAATAATHDVVMGLGPEAFDSIVASVREILDYRNNFQPGLRVNISFVLNRDNIHELADFVELGNSLGVTSIYLRTLNPQSGLSTGLNYHRLPPYLHPSFAEHVEAGKRAIARSKSAIVADVESWGAPVFPARVEELVRIGGVREVERKDALKDRTVREFYSHYYEGLAGNRGLGELLDQAPVDPLEDGGNPFSRAPHLHCGFVYQDFIVNDFNLRLIPCCYMAQVPGFDVVRYDGSRPFFEYWNSPAFRALRRSLKDGPLYGACKKCPAQAAPPAATACDPGEPLRAVAGDVFNTRFEASGPKLFKALRPSIYGAEQGTPALRESEEGLRLSPTDPKDHLATPFVKLSGTGRWLRVRAEWRGSPEAISNCVFTVQGDDFRMLPAVVFETEEAPRGNVVERFVPLSENVNTARVMLGAWDEKPALMPWALEIAEA